MSIDKQVKVNLVLEASQALNSVTQLSKVLKEISSVNIGNANNQMRDLAKVTAEFQRAIKDTTKATQDMMKAVTDANGGKAIKTRIDSLNKEQQTLDKLLATQKQVNTQQQVQSKQTSKLDSQGWMAPQGFTQYKTQLGDLSKQAEYWHQAMGGAFKNISKEVAEGNLTRIKATMNEITDRSRSYNTEMNNLVPKWNLLENLGNKFKSHFLWIGTGMILDSLISIPTAIFNTMTTVEKGMAGMIQTLPQLHDNQSALNKVTKDFLDISATYGERIENIIEAGKLWSRGYKDIAMVEAFMHSSAVLAVADSFGMVEANKSLEATMMQYGWTARNTAEATAYSMRIVDAWTNVAHNAQVSAHDLSQANERAASSAKMVGVEFETLQGLISAGVKNTGRSGAEIGNTLKSIFGSIHSDKSQEEIEALGVKMKYVAEDGSEHFRKIEDVLMDLSIATKGTSKNLEELFKSVAGGKFQWSKTSALLQYKDIVDGINLAVNSHGVAHKQVLAQMDTIARKVEQVKANLQGLITGMADAGLSKFIKEQLDGLNSTIKVLQQIPSLVYTSVAKIGELALIFYGVNLAVTRFNATLALTAVEMTAVGTATTFATGGLNILVGILALAGSGLLTYSMFHTSASHELEGHRQKTDDLIASKMEEIELNKRQIEFVERLGNNYQVLSAKLQAIGDDEKKAKGIKEDLMVTEKALGDTLGQEALQRIKDAGFVKEAIDLEKQAHSNKKNQLITELGELRSASSDYTDKLINETQNRIDTIAKEGEAWYKYSQIVKFAYEQFAGIMDKQIEIKQVLFNNIPSFMNAEKSRLAESLQSDIDYRESLRGKSVGELDGVIDGLQKEIRDLKTQRIKDNLSNDGTLFAPTGTQGGDGVPDAKDSSKNSSDSGNSGGSHRDIDWAGERERAKFRQDERDLMLELTKSANEYAGELDKINTKEQIYGKSVSTTQERLNVYAERSKTIATEIGKIDSKEEELKTKIIALQEGDSDWETIVSNMGVKYKTLDKAGKVQAVRDFANLKQDHATIDLILQLLDKLEEKKSELSKDSIKIADDFDKTKRDDSVRKKKFNDDMSDIDLKEKENLDELNPNDPFIQFKEAGTKLEAVRDRLIRINEEMRSLKSQMIDGSGKDISTQEQRDQLKDLSNKAIDANSQVKQLNKTFEDVQKGMADMVWSILGEGKSFKDIWKDLWKGIAKDALNALMGIKGGTTSLLGQLFGSLFGSGLKAKTAHSGESVGYPKMHSGGDVMGAAVVPHLRNDEVVRTLQVGEEVNSLYQRRTNEIMGAVAMKAIDVQAQKPTNIVISAVDSRSFVQYLDSHGDALVQILRKQNALGNR